MRAIPVIRLLFGQQVLQIFAVDVGQASNYYVSAEVAQQYSCGDACQQAIAEGNAEDLKIYGTRFDYDFYKTAANFSGSKPGDVLKFELNPPSNLSTPAGVAAYKIHGVFRGCAPSTSASLYDYTSWNQLVIAGYAVVATDYAGLGNNYTSHNLVQDPASGYLGGVAVAPVSKIYDALVSLDELRKLLESSGSNSPLSLGVLPSAVLGVKATFPDYEAPVISQTMRTRIELAKIGQFCDAAISGLTSDLGFDALSNFTAESDTILKQFQELNAPAQGDSASKPLLLILGEEDTIVSEESGTASWKDSCEHGNIIHLSVYPGLDHSAVLTAATPEWLRFIQDRFASNPVENQCVNETKIPFDLDNAQRPLDTY
ncbi:hypothetical protein CGCF415_v009266 [Colletotrichum fructicola]|uniref:Secretory lipase, putative n=2 Tax=Colletotrichum fructicola (strain Nara gc5) TaxID=1213859 RepID=L2FIB3_COLFN|nr:hypothetical protein CFRS1_v013298 [Colletotrichum fructicola]KAF4900014.1 hypothetical protein CGCFRS4_v003550 [Colletotrichum fructicola]KAF4902707.1 hypothetical protein CGCF415_v009266 [Colletotrichum fructicola]KAF4938556.1 hypothetical protein CGCF245_v004436 [Colletotrichum fructicola]